MNHVHQEGQEDDGGLVKGTGVAYVHLEGKGLLPILWLQGHSFGQHNSQGHSHLLCGTRGHPFHNTEHWERPAPIVRSSKISARLHGLKAGIFLEPASTANAPPSGTATL